MAIARTGKQGGPRWEPSPERESPLLLRETETESPWVLAFEQIRELFEDLEVDEMDWSTLVEKQRLELEREHPVVYVLCTQFRSEDAAIVGVYSTVTDAKQDAGSVRRWVDDIDLVGRPCWIEDPERDGSRREIHLRIMQ